MGVAANEASRPRKILDEAVQVVQAQSGSLLDELGHVRDIK